VRQPHVVVHRDVEALALVRGGQQRVVGGGRAHLDREHHREALALGERQHLADEREPVGPRQRQLHLREAHVPGAREHAVRGIDPHASARDPGRDPVDGRDRARHPGPQPARCLEDVGGEQPVLGPRADRVAWRRRRVDDVVGAGPRGVAVGEVVELDVPVGRRPVEGGRQHPLQRLAAVLATPPRSPPRCSAGGPRRRHAGELTRPVAPHGILLACRPPHPDGGPRSAATHTCAGATQVVRSRRNRSLARRAGGRHARTRPLAARVHPRTLVRRETDRRPLPTTVVVGHGGHDRTGSAHSERTNPADRTEPR
jgi:hypothetical protein